MVDKTTTKTTTAATRCTRCQHYMLIQMWMSDFFRVSHKLNSHSRDTRIAVNVTLGMPSMPVQLKWASVCACVCLSVCYRVKVQRHFENFIIDRCWCHPKSTRGLKLSTKLLAFNLKWWFEMCVNHKAIRNGWSPGVNWHLLNCWYRHLRECWRLPLPIDRLWFA